MHDPQECLPGPGAAGVDPAGTKSRLYDAFASVLKALGSGRRLELVELLAQGEHSVETLARMSGAAVSTVSANLQILRQAGLVVTRRQATTIFYRLAGDEVAELYVVAETSRAGLQQRAARCSRGAHRWAFGKGAPAVTVGHDR